MLGFFKDLFKSNEDIKIQKETGKSSWFGFSVILDGKLKNRRDQILNELNNKGIETRPIISGNFLKYPVTKFLIIRFMEKLKIQKK